MIVHRTTQTKTGNESYPKVHCKSSTCSYMLDKSSRHHTHTRPSLSYFRVSSHSHAFKSDDEYLNVSPLFPIHHVLTCSTHFSLSLSGELFLYTFYWFSQPPLFTLQTNADAVFFVNKLILFILFWLFYFCEGPFTGKSGFSFLYKIDINLF